MDTKTFNDMTLTMVCDFDDQLVRYIGKNLNNLTTEQVTALLSFVRGIRSLKKAMIAFEKELSYDRAF
ncbi:hypothetical protein LCGC14_2980880 [marine sediment metagenome]|uniref:Uncharacterized protein n=1 Tax=marine sediment metagenome TaxID=412755 RepID=A0A0F8ZE47_9ZZZZ